MVGQVLSMGLRFAGPLALVLAATPALGSNVVEIEEHWALSVGGPEPDRSAPQVSMVMSASGDTRGDYFMVSVNHWSDPDFSPGGVQVQHWRGDECLSSANAPTNLPLHVDGETVRWVQRISLTECELTFEVDNGQSESWGPFAGSGALRVSTETGAASLNPYKAAVSINESGIGYGGNRVSGLVLEKLRWRVEGETEFQEMVAPIDIDTDLLDP